MTIAVKNPNFLPNWVDPKNYHLIPLAKAGNFGLKNASAVYELTFRIKKMEANHF